MRKIALVVGSNLLSNGLDKTNDILACNRAKWIISQHERLPFKDGNPNSYTAIVVYDLVLPNTTVLCRVKVTEFHMSSNPTFLPMFSYVLITGKKLTYSYIFLKKVLHKSDKMK